MSDAIFKDTMVNMKWIDIQYYADENAVVLLPLGVIEEHGPHLCLGTDIYIAHAQCLYVKQKLEKDGHKVAIAPPFYWGICQATGSFIGSFKIRKETAKALLFDIIASLDEFGYKKVYGISGHGDIEHNIAIIEAFKEVSEKLSINARYAFLRSVMHHYGLNGDEAYICPVEPQSVRINTSEYADVHGGDIETAVMYNLYPHLTDVKKAKSLKPVSLGEDKIMTWLLGGNTKNLSHQGYLGAPADYEGVEVPDYFNDIASRIYQSILKSI